MDESRFQDIVSDVHAAECKLESIYQTTLLAMDAIEGSPISSNPNYMRLYHLLNVQGDGMLALKATLDEIGQAAVLGLQRSPA